MQKYKNYPDNYKYPLPFNQLSDLFFYIVDFNVYRFLFYHLWDLVDDLKTKIFFQTKFSRFTPRFQPPALSFLRTDSNIENYDYSLVNFFPLAHSKVHISKLNKEINPQVVINLSPQDIDITLFESYEYFSVVYDTQLNKLGIYLGEQFPLPDDVWWCRVILKQMSYEINYVTLVRDPFVRYSGNRFLSRLSELFPHPHPQKFEAKYVILPNKQILKLDNMPIFIFLDNIEDTTDYTILEEGKYYTFSATLKVIAPFVHYDKYQKLDAKTFEKNIKGEIKYEF